MTKMNFDVKDHILVPKHEKIAEEKVNALLKKYNITKLQLPKISKKDPILKGLDFKVGDVIKITRDSGTAGRTSFYRVIISE